MANLCLKIINQDRVGLVLDISKVLVEQNINILSMEVSPNIMYLEIQELSPKNCSLVIQQLSLIAQVNHVIPISHMPYQEREQQLQAVMDTIGDGIIAIDQQEVITHFNPASEQILGYKTIDVLGKKIRDILGSNIPLLKTVQDGTVYNNRELIIMTPKGESHYITSGRPLKDDTGSIIGAVAVLKAMTDVKELVYSVIKPQISKFADIIHISDSMKQTINMAKLVAKNNSTILIRGESGTGKELFARSIHMESPRSEKIFAPINCAALPDALMESELFGYEDGSFTGAKKGGKLGLFEYANGGTIFLDEIGELSSNLQAKLLRFLQEGKVRRIGGDREISVNVRIIAATHRNLEDMIRKNEFREDLYYRLNVIPLYIPPLRERKEDLPILIESLLLKINHRLKKQVTHIAKPAMTKLLHHDWVGNVRELENVIERAVSLACQGEINAEHIMIDKNYVPTQPLCLPTTTSNLKDIISEVECRILREAIKKHRTSRQVGKHLGLSHTSVLARMRKYNLKEIE
ncbi:sigma 54-interacting transcriptional regulator [Dendrosporobacter sp. 1207_IL3150]|uniref:sigma 54-interacting transcriptional regulator n=1 Tax=Dendrosporobacter sp. 1207_IL3150 TaxID=3084054 RepID=UPI003FA5AF60